MRRLFSCLLLLGFAGSIAACSRQVPAPAGHKGEILSVPSQPVPGDWVVIQIPSDPDSLNPITGQDSTGQEIRYPNIFESLLFLDNDTLKLKPLLAESWEISPDQMTYTFHLRHGVKWQDGVPLTADDVKYSFEKIMDPKVDGAALRIYFSNITSCVVVDPYTIRFTAKERYFKTVEVLGTFLYIIPRHVLEKGEPDFNRHPFGRAPVGTGPYRFVSWDTDAQIVLERNDDYWGPHHFYPKRLVYQIIAESYIATQLLKKGDIDVVEEMSPTQWMHELAHSRAMAKLNRIVYPYPAYSYLGFNLRRPLFADVRVRHAIDLLVPRDEILSRLYFNEYATKTSGYDVPSEASYNHAVAPTPYDPALAQQLLSAAGWKNDHGDGFLYKDGQRLSFEVLYPSGSTGAQKVCEMIQESFARGGIELRLASLDFAQLIAKTEDWNFDTVLASWSLDTNGDPTQIWASSEATQKKSSNFIGYASPEADRLLAAARVEYDDEKRAALYRQLHQLIHDDYPVCFLFNPQMIMVVSKRFQNVRVFVPRPCFDPTSWWVPAEQQKYSN